MKTSIPCAYILTEKTCVSHRENLLLLKRNPVHIAYFQSSPLFYPAVYDLLEILFQRGF